MLKLLQNKNHPTSFTVIKVCCSASLRVEVFEAGNMEFSLRFGAEEKLLLLLLAELFPSLLALSFPLLFSFFQLVDVTAPLLRLCVFPPG